MTRPFDCEIRPYRSCDASATLAVFRDAVMLTASKDYTPEQIAARAGQDNPTLSANVRVAALRFFAHRGFIVQAVQHPIVGGVQLTNHHMTKNLR